jgi:hypothetical protein
LIVQPTETAGRGYQLRKWRASRNTTANQAITAFERGNADSNNFNCKLPRIPVAERILPYYVWGSPNMRILRRPMLLRARSNREGKSYTRSSRASCWITEGQNAACGVLWSNGDMEAPES